MQLQTRQTLTVLLSILSAAGVFGTAYFAVKNAKKEAEEI